MVSALSHSLTASSSIGSAGATFLRCERDLHSVQIAVRNLNANYHLGGNFPSLPTTAEELTNNILYSFPQKCEASPCLPLL